MKRPSPYVDRRGDASMDSTMTPMIDVVFLLLVFFVWTASFQLAEQILPSQVSAQAGNQAQADVDPPPEQDFEKIVVRIRWDGASPLWSINDDPVASIDDVRSLLEQIAAVKLDAPVILHPDGEVPLGHVIQAYDVASIAGFDKVSFAVNAAQP